LPDIAAGHDASAREAERRLAIAELVLDRYGVVTRETLVVDDALATFSDIYPVLKAMEEAGRLRRGYFVKGLMAAQFARPGAEQSLRERKQGLAEARTLLLSAVDPASPYGGALPWPETASHPGRTAGASVILRAGRLIGFLGRAERSLGTFSTEPDDLKALARSLGELVDSGRRRALLLDQIDGAAPNAAPLAPHLIADGFVATSRGFLRRALGPRG
jgi:ATP-dependent Lhr-like helicase